MPAPLLTRRDSAIWLAGFLLVATLIISTRFTSEDPDSALYANLSARLAQGPASRWIAPEWWGEWNSEGLFREHPGGIFLLPTALGAMGVPAVQAAYVVGVAAGLASLLLLGVIVHRLASRDEARLALVLLQIMPVAFLFRIRSNHEYPMLMCLLAMLVGLDGVRRRWAWAGLVAASLTFALLVKGVFVILLFIAAGLWVLINPTCERGSRVRPIAAIALSLVAMAGTAYAYDAWYLSVTGEHFWLPYWRRQLGPLEIATPLDGASTLAGHLVFYIIRLLWHPAPWSLALLVAAWSTRTRIATWWREAPESTTRGLLFALAFAACTVGLLLPSSRFAERYAFSATYAIATAGVVVACRHWPRFAEALRRADTRIPALPALVWTALMVLRLALGPILPRISVN